MKFFFILDPGALVAYIGFAFDPECCEVNGLRVQTFSELAEDAVNVVGLA